MSSSQKDNWRELAELLGLPADAPAPAAVPPAASPAPVAPALASDPGSATERLPPVAELATPAPEEEVFLDAASPLEEDIITDDVEIDAALVAPEIELTEDGDKPQEEKRGRRRGRRGRRRGRDDASEGAEAPQTSDAPASDEAAVAAAPVADKDDDRDEERGRGRRRHAHAENAGPDIDAATAVADDTSDQDEDFSEDAWADWNVPNWQELIDGLYRPDR